MHLTLPVDASIYFSLRQVGRTSSSKHSSAPSIFLTHQQKLTKRRSAPVTMTRASSSSKAMGSSESAQQPQTDPGLRELQTLCASFHLSCSTCRFSIEVDLEGQIEAWRSGAQSIPPSTQISALRCSEGHLTCAGCGEGPKFSSENVFTSLGVINHCCDAGRLFCLWLLLARYDEAQLSTTSPASSTPRKGM